MRVSSTQTMRQNSKDLRNAKLSAQMLLHDLFFFLSSSFSFFPFLSFLSFRQASSLSEARRASRLQNMNACLIGDKSQRQFWLTVSFRCSRSHCWLRRTPTRCCATLCWRRYAIRFVAANGSCWLGWRGLFSNDDHSIRCSFCYCCCCYCCCNLYLDGSCFPPSMTVWLSRQC